MVGGSLRVLQLPPPLKLVYFFLSQIIGGQNIACTYLEEKLKIQLID
jgi:hypothetical protein